jgi:hypothetical protein
MISRAMTIFPKKSYLSIPHSMDITDEPLNFQENMYPISNFAKRTLQFVAIHQKPQSFMKKTSDIPKINKFWQ